jgi:hypothetical protein
LPMEVRITCPLRLDPFRRPFLHLFDDLAEGVVLRKREEKMSVVGDRADDDSRAWQGSDGGRKISGSPGTLRGIRNIANGARIPFCRIVADRLAYCFALSGRRYRCGGPNPRALPWAGILPPFRRTLGLKGRNSRGQRPGTRDRTKTTLP